MPNINQKWIFGAGCGLDFSTAIPAPFAGSLINTNEGCASVADVSGNLLFYTDGQTIWDSVGTVRASGLQGKYLINAVRDYRP
jgi:hypothetical protein